MSHLIHLHDVSKKFGKLKAVEGVSLTISKENTILITGENGAGKSTLIKLLAGLYSCDKGRIEKLTDKISYLGTSCGLYGPLSCKDNFEFFTSKSVLDSEKTLKDWGVFNLLNKAVKDLSKGQQYRLALCIMFCCDAELFLLDEPTAYLDKEAIDLFCSSILKSKKTYVIATHDVERLSFSTAVNIKMKDGAIVL